MGDEAKKPGMYQAVVPSDVVSSDGLQVVRRGFLQPIYFVSKDRIDPDVMRDYVNQYLFNEIPACSYRTTMDNYMRNKSEKGSFSKADHVSEADSLRFVLDQCIVGIVVYQEKLDELIKNKMLATA